MARKSRQSFLKRQREARRAERAALKRQKRMERKQKGPDDATEGEDEVIGGDEYLELPEDVASEVAAQGAEDDLPMDRES